MSASEQRIATFDTLVAEAAEALQLEPSHQTVQTLASLRFALQATTEKMISGGTVNPDALLALNEAITRLQPVQSHAFPEIKIEIVRPLDAAPSDGPAVDGLLECRRCGWRPDGKDRCSKCYRCGWTHGADTSAPWSPPFLDDAIKAAEPQPQQALAAPR